MTDEDHWMNEMRKAGIPVEPNQLKRIMLATGDDKAEQAKLGILLVLHALDFDTAALASGFGLAVADLLEEDDDDD